MPLYGCLGCNGGCGSNDGKGFSCANTSAVNNLREHIRLCQDRQARGNRCRTCDAICDSPAALSMHESVCESMKHSTRIWKKSDIFYHHPGKSGRASLVSFKRLIEIYSNGSNVKFMAHEASARSAGKGGRRLRHLDTQKSEDSS